MMNLKYIIPLNEDYVNPFYTSDENRKQIRFKTDINDTRFPSKSIDVDFSKINFNSIIRRMFESGLLCFESDNNPLIVSQCPGITVFYLNAETLEGTTPENIKKSLSSICEISIKLDKLVKYISHVYMSDELYNEFPLEKLDQYDCLQILYAAMATLDFIEVVKFTDDEILNGSVRKQFCKFVERRIEEI